MRASLAESTAQQWGAYMPGSRLRRPCAPLHSTATGSPCSCRAGQRAGGNRADRATVARRRAPLLWHGEVLDQMVDECSGLGGEKAARCIQGTDQAWCRPVLLKNLYQRSALGVLPDQIVGDQRQTLPIKRGHNHGASAVRLEGAAGDFDLDRTVGVEEPPVPGSPAATGVGDA